MTFKLGNTSINKLFLGATEIKRAYLGATEIFDSTAAPSGVAITDFDIVWLPGTAHTDLYVENTGAAATTLAVAEDDWVRTIHDKVNGVYYTAPDAFNAPKLTLSGGKTGIKFMGADYARIGAGTWAASTGNLMQALAIDIAADGAGGCLVVSTGTTPKLHQYDNGGNAALGLNSTGTATLEVDGVAVTATRGDAQTALGTGAKTAIFQTTGGPTASQSWRLGLAGASGGDWDRFNDVKVWGMVMLKDRQATADELTFLRTTLNAQKP